MSEARNPTWPGPAAEDEIRALLARARAGDPAALPALRAALDRHPEVWRSYGDLAACERDAWIGLISGEDLALRESLGRRAEAMQATVAGPAPSPLEGLLAERIVACWLQLAYYDAAIAQAGDVPIAQAEHARKRQDSAHRRYLMAIATLATIRRLLPAADARANPGVLPVPERGGRHPRPAPLKPRKGKPGGEAALTESEALLAFRRSAEERCRGDDPDFLGSATSSRSPREFRGKAPEVPWD